MDILMPGCWAHMKEIDWIDKVETDVHIGKFFLLPAFVSVT